VGPVCKEAQDDLFQSKKYMGVFVKKKAAPHVSSKMTLDQFVPSVQVVVPRVLVLQVMVLNCTSNISCGTKNVYSSSKNLKTKLMMCIAIYISLYKGYIHLLLC
jgi:hypothetical protein